MRKEILAYAITHAGYTPEGKAIKGGPYRSRFGKRTPSLVEALRWPDTPNGHLSATTVAGHFDARVIRIVRKAQPSEASGGLYIENASDRPWGPPSRTPSEASAVEVLRELVAWVDSKGGGFNAILGRARRVLAAVDAYRKAGGK